MKFHIVLTLQILQLPLIAADASSGRVHYERLKAHSESCWEGVVQRLETHCSDLPESARAHMALDLANCHLRRSGLAEVQCGSGQRFDECTRDMDQRAWTAYTEFYTHVFDVCAFLAEKVWRERTLRTVDALTQSADSTLRALDVAATTVADLQSGQSQLQLDIADSTARNSELRAHIEASRAEVSTMAATLVESAETVRKELKAQQELVSAWLGKVLSAVQDIASLQESIFGEIVDLRSMLYYLTHAVLIYVSTSITETSYCRSRLLFLLLVEMLLERCLRSFLFSAVSILRLLIAAASILSVFGAYSNYRDVNTLNHQLLLQLIKAVSDRAKLMLSSVRPQRPRSHRRVFFPLDKIREVRPEQEIDGDWKPRACRHLRF